VGLEGAAPARGGKATVTYSLMLGNHETNHGAFSDSSTHDPTNRSRPDTIRQVRANTKPITAITPHTNHVYPPLLKGGNACTPSHDSSRRRRPWELCEVCGDAMAVGQSGRHLSCASVFA
jgi:hypothetical protein